MDHRFLPSSIPDLTDKIVRPDNHYSEAGGRFGDVFKCLYKSVDGVKEVAVKVFRFSFTVDEDKHDKRKDARTIRRELGIWSRLSHHNIVPFLGVAHGFGRQGNTSLVSIWMPHGTLHTFLEAHESQLMMAHRLQLLSDIASGLEYLHSFSIVHGDLSSNNVLLDHNYNACLTDFGCASLIGNHPEGYTYLQMSTASPGTVRWAAPEHFSADEKGPEHTIKSDIYSFGNMALLVLSGKYPWSELRVDAAVMLQLSLGRKPPRPLIPPVDDRYWTLVEQCWSPIPDRPLAQKLVATLREFLDAYPASPTLREHLDVTASSPGVSVCLSDEDAVDIVSTQSQSDQPRSCATTSTDASAQPSSLMDMTLCPDAPNFSPDPVPRPQPQALRVDTQPFVTRDAEQKTANECDDGGAKNRTPEPEGTGNPTKISPRRQPLSKWVRGTLLGRGMYGRVYLGLDPSTGEMIAVKQVEKDDKDAQRLNFVLMMKHEREIHSRLDHPNIVAYLGSEETSTSLTLFLEYVPGGSIGSCLRTYGSFDEQVIKSFTGQILQGLAYLHANNIIHRNIEVNTILVYLSGVCKISGFANAQRVDDGASWIPIRGIVFWTAPEMISSPNGKRYDTKVDIWSAGCVLLGMWMWRRRAFGDREVFASMVHASHQETGTSTVLSLGVTLSDLAVEFSDKCFAMNPETRASATELVQHPYLMLSPDWSFTGF